MARGEIEQLCFDTVKETVLSKNICYACSVEDEYLIKRAFQTSSPNANLSAFPDFVFDGGFIEHFEVTSSHSNRNGSMMRREKSELRKEAEAKEQALRVEMDKAPCYEGKTITTDTWHSRHTYDNFCYSFKKSWEHHIVSLDKYGGNKSVGIFLVQYNDSALVLDSVFPDVKKEIYYGDLIEKPDYRGYRLTHDSEMLSYIYQFSDKIKYVVFNNFDGIHGNRCEIICVENIPEILKIVKGKYKYHCAMVGSAHAVYAISTQNPLFEGDLKNDQT